MGVAIGDYDADGYPDVYITALGKNHLYRNRGNGRFDAGLYSRRRNQRNMK